MNDELKELMKNILGKEELRKNLVLMTYEQDSDDSRETIERVSLVYETKSLNEGFG